MPENTYVFMSDSDSDSDLPYRYVDDLRIPMVYMPYVVDGKEYLDDLGRDGNQKEYFDNMRDGAVPVTSLLPVAAYVEYFEPILQAGKDILFLAFSSQLSGTIQNIYTARKELLEKYPERNMVVVDTLSISGPQAILILAAHEMYRDGKSIEEVAGWVEENKLKAHAWITVEDLKYLRRGGRISAVAAAVGTVLDLKPVITLNKEGKLVSVEKVQGRKRALRILADRLAESYDPSLSKRILILHADAPEDAERLIGLIRSRVPEDADIELVFVGPVIGAHCGPGTIAVCFMGAERPH